MHKDFNKKEEAKAGGKHSHQHLKVVKMSNFAGGMYELQFGLLIIKYAVSLEKIIIQLCPSIIWRGTNKETNISGGYEEKQYRSTCLWSAQLLKTQILQMHPNSNVILIT